MKHGDLRSVAHNIAASLASGIGLLIGMYDFDVFADAKNGSGKVITVDFLKGTISGGDPAPDLVLAVQRYRDVLPDFCAKHGVSLSAYTELTARYFVADFQRRFAVTIKDQTGRETTTEYEGFDGQRVKTVDGEGRRRPKRVLRT